MTCTTCQHYSATMRTCMALAGVLECTACQTTWQMADRFDCPKCMSYGRPVDDIIDGVPSEFCPGHVPRVEVKKQRGLFDELG